MGRPSKFNRDFIEQARKLAALGLTHTEMAHFFGVTPRTIDNWRLEHREFARAILIGDEVANSRVEMSLYQQALGYERDEEEIKVIDGAIVRVPVKRFYPPNASASIFWLKAKNKWRDDGEEPLPPPPMDTDTGEPTHESDRQIARRVMFTMRKLVGETQQ